MIRPGDDRDMTRQIEAKVGNVGHEFSSPMAERLWRLSISLP